MNFVVWKGGGGGNSRSINTGQTGPVLMLLLSNRPPLPPTISGSSQNSHPPHTRTHGLRLGLAAGKVQALGAVGLFSPSKNLGRTVISK